MASVPILLPNGKIDYFPDLPGDAAVAEFYTILARREQLAREQAEAVARALLAAKCEDRWTRRGEIKTCLKLVRKLRVATRRPELWESLATEFSRFLRSPRSCSTP